MEIKVNEYVRIKEGVIDKVIIDYKGKCNNPNCNSKHISCEKNYYNEDDIVKHSPNLIDLIQCGDYVNGEQVNKNKYGELYIGYVYAGGEIGRILEPYATFIKDMKEEDIETIVTKEMMQSISYKP